jgi:hypothetical protein
MMTRVFILLSVLYLAPALALAQSADCPELVETALDVADQLCTETGRNQACYGHVALTAELTPDAESVAFEQAGDIVDVALVESLRLDPLDVAAGEWGVALMNLQANLPDTLPGQNVTFLMFGDVEITSAVEPDNANELQPMQAFYLRTGIGDAPCEEAPESGLIVQTPEGAGTVLFNVNGVDVEMGSTVLFQADVEIGMTVSTLEGAAYVSAEGGSQPIFPGTWVRIALNERLLATDPPGLPLSYIRRQTLLQALPLRLLRRQIEIIPGLDDGQLERLQARILTGDPLCGEDGLPACDRYPFLRGERQCLLIQGPLCKRRGPGG